MEDFLSPSLEVSSFIVASYGGADGIPVGTKNFMLYAFSRISVCDQSYVIMLIQFGTLFWMEQDDGQIFLNFDIYNKTLGMFSVN